MTYRECLISIAKNKSNDDEMNDDGDDEMDSDTQREFDKLKPIFLKMK